MKYIQDKIRTETREAIYQLIFLGIEALHLSYIDIMNMPISMLEYLVIEKDKFQEELQNRIDNRRG